MLVGFFSLHLLISQRKLIYNVSSCFLSIFIFSSGWRAIWVEIMLIHLFTFLRLSISHFILCRWMNHNINICPVDQLCCYSTSKNSPGGSLSGFTSNDTTNQSSSSVIHLFITLCFYSFTQHILIKCTIRELTFY